MRPLIDLAELARELAPHLRPLLATAAEGTTYSSANLPPDTNARTFARWCRTGRVAGARADGRGWRCSVEAWKRARAAGKRKPAALAVLPTDEEFEAAEMVRTATSRNTRRSA